MADLNLDKYREFVLTKIRKTKNPLGSGTTGLVGKTAQKKMGCDLFELERLLTVLRKEGAVFCTAGKWWLPK